MLGQLGGSADFYEFFYLLLSRGEFKSINDSNKGVNITNY